MSKRSAQCVLVIYHQSITHHMRLHVARRWGSGLWMQVLLGWAAARMQRGQVGTSQRRMWWVMGGACAVTVWQGCSGTFLSVHILTLCLLPIRSED